jgi:hypothetical protein
MSGSSVVALNATALPTDKTYAPKKSTETEFETTTAGHVRAAFVHYMRQIIRVVNALSDCRVSI